MPYWGKARPRTEGPAWHPLAYHALDVAATGRVLLEQTPSLHGRLSTLSGIPSADCIDWLALLLAWHDVGKFAEGFQQLVPGLRAALGHPQSTVDYRRRHDTLGQLVFEDHLCEALAEAAERFHPGLDDEGLCDALVPWTRAVTGHHGAPPGSRDRFDAISDPLKRHFPPRVLRAAAAWIHDSFDLLWRRPLPLALDDIEAAEATGQRVSWLVAGLAVAADWIGSDQGWFPYHAPTLGVADYWHTVALPRAARAVAESGLAVHGARGLRPLEVLFPYIREPTPLQAQATAAPLLEGPQVWLIEEATGGGKTEAALMLAHRLIAAGRADRLYVALPTMATANAMHRRVEAMYTRLFDDAPTLVLSHGKAALAHALTRRARAEADYAEGDVSATTRSAAWFADHRKAGLLAPVGVGTVDQALLGVLASKHQALRLMGLAGAVLIVDEVHACDAYMHRLLCRLLRFQGALGGSAILLSATVPEQTREALLGAFADGLGVARPRLTEARFPRITALASAGPFERAPETRDACRRSVSVQRTADVAEVVELLCAAVADGRCAAWVRNTVDDAIEGTAALSARLGPERVELFHARFALGDRLAIERRVLDRFGPDADPAARRGRVVVATQVIEQSLDLDFDLMVSDLAPIDLLVQRAGRLCRHRRDGDGRPVREGVDARGTPVLWVLGPDPDVDVDARWLRRTLPRMAPVYPDVGVLWRTARWLKVHGGFTLPEQSRDLIESVFGEEARGDYPEALSDAVMTAEGDAYAAGATARMSALAFEDGYVPWQSAWLDDARAVTRLGDPTVTLRLARVRDGICIPWHADPTAAPDARVDWQLSEVSVRMARVSGEAPGGAALVEAARVRMPDSGKYVCVVPLRVDADGVGHGEALDGRGRPVRLIHHPRTGLGFVRESGDA